MTRKKLSEMTYVERVDRALKDASWDQAEEAGIEILARCMALHTYAREEGGEYLADLMERILKRAVQWAHEGNHPTILAFASMGYKKEKEKGR
jgi:hypothetical protein